VSKRTQLDDFRRHQERLQLLVATVSPAEVLLKTERTGGLVAAYEARLKVTASRSSRFDIHIRERWSAPRQSSPDEYSYTVAQAEGLEVLAFHLHPRPRAGMACHLHLGAGAGSLMPELAAAHVPTGPVTAVHFVRFLIEDFGVRTLREDWRGVLESAERS
jgi:hypothetical protein